jgi:hypothetical protein
MKALFRQGTKAPLFFMIEKREEGAPFKTHPLVKQIEVDLVLHFVV